MTVAVTNTALIIVCTEEVAAQMNATLNQIDSRNDGDIMSVQLRRAGDETNTPVARWTFWNMPDGQRAAVLQAYAQQGWRPLRGSEGQVHGTLGGVPAFGTQRFWMFDGDFVDPELVLATLGLAELAATGY